ETLVPFSRRFPGKQPVPRMRRSGYGIRAWPGAGGAFGIAARRQVVGIGQQALHPSESAHLRADPVRPPPSGGRRKPRAVFVPVYTQSTPRISPIGPLASCVGDIGIGRWEGTTNTAGLAQ